MAVYAATSDGPITGTRFAEADNHYKLMTLDVDEFIRRFLIHVLPDGFHRIRHYGLFANANRAGNIALALSSSAYPIQLRQATKAMAPEMVPNTKSGTLVLAAAGA